MCGLRVADLAVCARALSPSYQFVDGRRGLWSCRLPTGAANLGTSAAQAQARRKKRVDHIGVRASFCGSSVGERCQPALAHPKSSAARCQGGGGSARGRERVRSSVHRDISLGQQHRPAPLGHIGALLRPQQLNARLGGGRSRTCSFTDPSTINHHPLDDRFLQQTASEQPGTYRPGA